MSRDMCQLCREPHTVSPTHKTRSDSVGVGLMFLGRPPDTASARHMKGVPRFAGADVMASAPSVAGLGGIVAA
jgi:hypothetical protein